MQNNRLSRLTFLAILAVAVASIVAIYLVAGPRLGAEQLAGLPGPGKPVMAAANRELASATSSSPQAPPQATVQAAASPNHQQQGSTATATDEPPIAAPPTELPTAPTVGAIAPDFALLDLDGQSVSLSSLRGKVVLLNFWATW